jgi:signal transduction histidine kinase
VTLSVDELWLATLQKLAAHVAHDLKGALNGASVNLEVVRSRSERESTTGADVHRFAENAAEQLALVIRATTALLALARGTRGPVEVSMVARQLANLLDDMSKSASGRLQVVVDGGMAAETSAPLSAVRFAIAECLLAVSSGSEPVTVRVTGLPSPHVHISPGTPPALAPEAAAVLRAAGIFIDTDGHGISIALPGPLNSERERAEAEGGTEGPTRGNYPTEDA